MSFADHLAEDRRLRILRLLAEAPGYEANQVLLSNALSMFGHMVSADVVATDCAWLAEQGLVERQTMSGIEIVRITARGVDVAMGRAVVPGVQRPRPGE